MDIIKAEKLTKVYKVSEDVETIALENVSFTIKKGEY
ncbi:ABC transporter ATP-binding protein, partial [Candidatus Beckwithbacteria bacterium]|nr:ABC transporter ATP-binding protein [Candidatus Beckwithbacteria bacterium]